MELAGVVGVKPPSTLKQYDFGTSTLMDRKIGKVGKTGHDFFDGVRTCEI